MFTPPPTFRSSPLLRGGHAQTLAGYLLPKGPAPPEHQTVKHILSLPDGDAVVLHEDTPEGWKKGDKAVLLLHGLSGSYQSGYMERTAARLNDRGVRVFRMDMRGCGAAYELAQYPAHSARIADFLAALARIDELSPGSPITVVGFSLGGNVVLNSLAEIGSSAEFPLEKAIAVCPPIDLVLCSGFLKSGKVRLYDRHFISALLKTVADRKKWFPEFAPIELSKKPTSLWDFDHAITAPLCGYDSAEAYYRATSPGPRLPEIRVPTLIVAAENDPLVPTSMFTAADLGPAVHLQLIPGGGHLGFISSRHTDPDHRWLDWRIVDWTLGSG